MQIPAGILSTKFGGRNVLCVAMIGWGSMTLLTPVSASLGFYPLLCCRAIMGMFEALAIPSIHALIGERIPKNERSRVVSISTAGQYVGCVIALSSSPLVSWKWSSVFYLFGAISILYVIFLVRIIPASFSKENTFSPLTNNGDDDDGGNNLNNNNKIELVTIESKYLVPSSFITSNNDNSKTNTTSLHDVFAALMYKPFLAVVVCHVAHNYGYYVLLSWLPTYFNDELDVDITHVGLAALSPYIFSAIADISFGHVVDYLIEVKGFTRTFARKLAQILAFLIPSAMLLSLSLFRISSLFAAVALLCVALSTNTLSHSGYWSNIVDIDPDRAGFLCGISNFFATLPGIYGNSLTGYILGGGGGTWSDVFLVTIIHWSVGLIFYAVFARAEIWVRT
jgi:MFS transporter, ACS family, solute carrier family 17 (sodium-dependent inorganic phosphate cotransporter), other